MAPKIAMRGGLPVRITRSWLEERGACDSQRNHFAETFPRGMFVNRKNLLEAAASNLQVSWLFGAFPYPSAQRVRAGRVQREIQMAVNRVREAIAAARERVDADNLASHRAGHFNDHGLDGRRHVARYVQEASKDALQVLREQLAAIAIADIVESGR